MANFPLITVPNGKKERKEALRQKLLPNNSKLTFNCKRVVFHAKTALKNAVRDFSLNKKERDIIRKHMFPLNLLPPLCRESWIVCLADKICAFSDMFKKSSRCSRK